MHWRILPVHWGKISIVIKHPKCTAHTLYKVSVGLISQSIPSVTATQPGNSRANLKNLSNLVHPGKLFCQIHGPQTFLIPFISMNFKLFRIFQGLNWEIIQ